MGGFPLLDRAADAVMFRRPSGPVTAAGFLGDVLALAGRLPGDGAVLNLCRDRYAFAVGFAAALVLGRTSLLNAEAGADAAVVSDEMVVRAAPAGLDAVPVIDGGLLAARVFTSGSTGIPVAHEKRWGTLVSRSRAAAAAFGLDGGAVVGTVPPQHMYGFETTVLLPLHAAVESWCGPAFFPGDVGAALREAPEPRTLVTTPLQLRTLLQAETALPALHGVISATAPLDTALAAEAEHRWGAPVREIFGATECGSIAHRRTTAGDVWTPYPGVSVKTGAEGAVVHAEAAEPVPLADVLERNGDGFRLLGRRTDLVKLGGRRASLTGLNRVLTGLPGVHDGAFVLPEGPGPEARLVAVVVAPTRTSPSILAELRRLLDPTFVPRRVVQVSELPRNELGKLPRQALLQLVAAAG